MSFGKIFISLFALVICYSEVKPQNNIPIINEVGVEVMPAAIKLYDKNPFNMPQLVYPKFPDYSVNIKERGAVINVPITKIVNDLIIEISHSGGGRVIIPKGKWKSGRIVLKSNVNLHFEEGAEIEFSDNPKDYKPSVFTFHEGRRIMGAGAFIYANNENNIAITGKGHIYGPPLDASIRKNSNGIAHDEAEWPKDIRKRLFDGLDGRRFLAPKVVSPVNCKNVLIEGLTIERSMFWNINPILCENVIICGNTVKSVGIPSGDGIDVSLSKNVLIEYCTMSCGDDCYAVKGARNEEGLKIGVPSENVIMRFCVAYDGHGGLTTGSETSGGIKNIFVYNCVFYGTQMPIRFKTRRPRASTTENIIIENIRMIDVENVFTWDMLGSPYFVGELGNRLPIRPVNELTPEIKNIQIKNFIVESAKNFINLRGLPERPLDDVLIESGKVRCENLIPEMTDFTNFTIRNLSINSEDNKINILDGRNLLLDNIAFVLPGNKLYINIQGAYSGNIKSQNIDTEIEMIKD